MHRLALWRSAYLEQCVAHIDVQRWEYHDSNCTGIKTKAGVPADPLQNTGLELQDLKHNHAIASTSLHEGN